MGFGDVPRLPLVGDATGDGYVDLLCVFPKDGAVFLYPNEHGEKPIRTRANDSVAVLGKNCLAAAVGRFSSEDRAEVIGITSDGRVSIAHGFSKTRFRYTHVAGKCPKPLTQATLTAGDFDGDGRDDAAVSSGDNLLLLLWNDANSDQPSFKVQSVGISPEPELLAAGDFDGSGKAGLAWKTPRGDVWRAKVTKDGLVDRQKIFRGKPEDQIVVGNFTKGKGRDLLVGATVLIGGNPKTMARWDDLTKPAGAAIVCIGDLNKDGRDDIIRFRRTGEKHTGSDVLANTTYVTSDPDWDGDGLTNDEERALGCDPTRRDTDQDGLLDGWEVRGSRGYDLAALGFSPIHKDVLCEIQRQDDVKEEMVKKELPRITAYYANLPVENPDGKTGIAFHGLLREPIIAASAKGKGWYELGQTHFAKEKRGVAHWLEVHTGGGGQSGQLDYMGGSGDKGFFSVFIHEFGHQLGLDHTGYFGPSWCPIYPSLMNYAYSYQFDGSPAKVHYSQGKFSKVVLSEQKLDERLPFPYKELQFLAKIPYRYRLKPDGEHATLIDWNWNGILGERGVRADINYGYSTNGGDRIGLATTVAAPSLLLHDGRLLLFYVSEPQLPKSIAAITPKPPTNYPERPRNGKILWRALLDKTTREKGWSKVETAVDVGVRGDPATISHKGEIFLVYPTEKGVEFLRGVLRKPSEKNGAPTIEWNQQGALSDSADAQASVASYADQLIAFLWTDKTKPLRYSLWDGKKFSAPRELGFTSTFPVGACVDTIKRELVVGLGQDVSKSRPSRWQIRRFTWDKTKGELVEGAMEWIGGKYGTAHGNLRPTLLFEHSRETGKEGRVHFIAGGAQVGSGLVSEKTPAVGFWDALQVADKKRNGGWLVKHYYDEWTNSRSAPAAAWFDNNIALASRWDGDAPSFRNNTLFVGYNGLGIDEKPMSDFDDIKHISEYGLTRSILYFETPTPPSNTVAMPPNSELKTIDRLPFPDVNGAEHLPLEQKKPTVAIFITNDCPIANAFAPEINRIVADYAAKGVAFYLVHVDPDLKAADAKKHAEDFGYKCAVLLDPKHKLVTRAGATVTPESAVFNASGTMIYRGRIDDRFADLGKPRVAPTTRDLRDALDAVLAGKAPPVATSTAVGCFIPR